MRLISLKMVLNTWKMSEFRGLLLIIEYLRKKESLTQKSMSNLNKVTHFSSIV